MRFRAATSLLSRSSPSLLLLLGACKTEPDAPELPPPSAPVPVSSALDLLAPRPSAAPLSSAVVAFEKSLQANKLPPPPRPLHAPQLAFGKGVFGQLTTDALRVYDAVDFRLLASEPLEAPRALLGLADGSLLAIGASTLLHWQREKKHAAHLARPVLLPGAQVYADAQRADRFWVADVEGGFSVARGPGVLHSYVLPPSDPSDVPVLLPEQSIELTSPRGGVFGVTREGTWLYVTAGRGERFGPGGLRLSGLRLSETELPTWLLPARRLDQSSWLQDSGQAWRVLVSPTYKRLASAPLPGRVVDADVGDEGELLAAVVVTGEGPRFELILLDQAFAQLARQVLPGDAPTGDDDWVKTVTANQGVVVAPREPRVAVGGPARVTIFDGQGKRIFSIPSM